MGKVVPKVLKQKEYLNFEICSKLSATDYNKIISASRDCHININISNCDKESLEEIIIKLSNIKNKEIVLVFNNVELDYNDFIPFFLLGKNYYIAIDKSPANGANFYNYLVNSSDNCYEGIKDKLNEDDFNTITAERKILVEFIKDLKNALLMVDGINNIRDLSNDEIMDIVFDYVKENYPYDFSIVGKNGEFIGCTYQKGGTAKIVYEREKGVCEGISKLLKLFLNNKYLNIPCYTINGHHGTQDHTWNEYISESGEIIEYDLSFGMKCPLDKIPSICRDLVHDVNVCKVLQKGKRILK